MKSTYTSQQVDEYVSIVLDNMSVREARLFAKNKSLFAQQTASRMQQGWAFTLMTLEQFNCNRKFIIDTVMAMEIDFNV